MELCENCGHENHKEPVVCEKCGSVLGNHSRRERESERQRLREILEFI
jgi:uncharacterized membrane protein YvbJ